MTIIENRAAGRRITATLFIAQSLYGASQIAGFTLLAIVAADLANDAGAAGIPPTIMFMARAAGAYPYGWLMDRLGRRAGLSLGYLAAALGSGVCVIAIETASFWGFCIGAALAGLGRSATEQTRFAAAEAQPVERRAKTIGVIVFAGTVGAVLGPMLVTPSGAWIATYGMTFESGPFFAGAVLTGLTVLLTFIFLRPDPLELARRYATEQDRDTAPDSIRPVGEILAGPTVRFAVVSMIIGQLVMTLLMVITPLHMDHHAHGTQAISGVIMAHTLGMFGLSGVTGWCVSRWGRMTVIRMGVILLAISSIITPVSPQFIPLAVALFLLGLGWNFCFIAGSSLLSDALAPLERGRVQGANEMLIAVAASVGSLSTGIAFEQGGILAVCVVGLSMSVLLGVYSMVMNRRISHTSGMRQTA